MSEIFGRRSLEPLAFYDPDTSSLRTCQASLLLMEGDSSTEFLATLPRSGMIVNGILYPLRTSAHPTCENDFGLLHTPRVVMIEEDQQKFVDRMGDRGDHCTGNLAMQIRDLPKILATPSAGDSQGSHGGGQGRSLRTDFRNLNHLTTPKATVKMDCKSEQERNTPYLDTVIKDAFGRNRGYQLRNAFVMWMMGYPIDWINSALKLEEMQSSQLSLNGSPKGSNKEKE